MTSISHPAWTDAEVATLRTHWAAGWSAIQCAEVLPGKTRNSVIGKVHRLGLLRIARPTGAPKPPGAPRQPKTAKAAPEPPQTRQSAFPLITFNELRSANTITQCRAIPGEPAGDKTLYCGAATTAGSSYCAYHHARCWKPYVPRKHLEAAS